MKPRVSIIIPQYNRVDCLKRVLPTYFNQKYVEEIIIIDDKSTDSTNKFLMELKKTHPAIKILLNKENLGLPATRMKAVKASKGNLIFFGENDLELSSNHIQMLVEHLEKSGGDIIAGRRFWMGKGETHAQAQLLRNTFKGDPVNMKLLTTNCELNLENDMRLPLIDASMLIKRNVLDEVSFDMFFRKNAFREESEFQINALKHGFILLSCPHTIGYHLYKENDVGGNHSQKLIHYEESIAKNTYYFVKKHEEFLKKQFNLKNIYVYMAVYTFDRILMKNIFPTIVKIKKKIFN